MGRKCTLLLSGTLSGRFVWFCDSSEIRKTNTVNGELEKQVGTISPPKRVDLKEICLWDEVLKGDLENLAKM